MDRSRFHASLSEDAPPNELSDLLQALWHDARGEWDRAHAIVQAQSGAEACAVHAYLHRKEGDLSNADYWYGRARRSRPATGLQAEWQALVDVLLAGPGRE